MASRQGAERGGGVSWDLPRDPEVVLARSGAPDTPGLRPQEHHFCSVDRMQPEDL